MGLANLFAERMRDADTRVILVAGDGPWSAGFDRAEDLDELPGGWSGWLWTNRADTIVPLLSP